MTTLNDVSVQDDDHVRAQIEQLESEIHACRDELETVRRRLITVTGRRDALVAELFSHAFDGPDPLAAAVEFASVHANDASTALMPVHKRADEIIRTFLRESSDGRISRPEQIVLVQQNGVPTRFITVPGLALEYDLPVTTAQTLAHQLWQIIDTLDRLHPGGLPEQFDISVLDERCGERGAWSLRIDRAARTGELQCDRGHMQPEVGPLWSALRAASIQAPFMGGPSNYDTDDVDD